ncbi:hypothetical protein FACS1894186_8190 [Alphaproteobacteria bacterium]|nr:hypothetical protein FACS1894186_8190 [Alphaproteobacteria bacterium]
MAQEAAAFDSATLWPASDKMPAGFDPAAVLETGKNPGMGVRALHAAGLTGKGVNTAIIDQTINPGHAEIRHCIAEYWEKGYDADAGLEMHGLAISSILAGLSCGVAPDAKVFYFAAGTRVNGETSNANYLDALRKIHAMNEQGAAIKVVSISWALRVKRDATDDFKPLIDALEKQGTAVISTNSYLKFTNGNDAQFLGANRTTDGEPPRPAPAIMSITPQAGAAPRPARLLAEAGRNRHPHGARGNARRPPGQSPRRLRPMNKKPPQ